jgi:hypothetical protein
MLLSVFRFCAAHPKNEKQKEEKYHSAEGRNTDRTSRHIDK